MSRILSVNHGVGGIGISAKPDDPICRFRWVLSNATLAPSGMIELTFKADNLKGRMFAGKGKKSRCPLGEKAPHLPHFNGTRPQNEIISDDAREIWLEMPLALEPYVQKKPQRKSKGSARTSLGEAVGVVNGYKADMGDRLILEIRGDGTLRALEAHG